MTASVASSWGPGFVVGVRRPARFSGRPKAARASVDQARLAPVPRVSRVAPVAAPAAVPPSPMRRRFQAGVPAVDPPVSRRARRIERPVPGQARARARVRVRSVSSRAPWASRPAAVPSKLRLTRRGRVLLLVLVAVAVYAAFGLGRASAGGAALPAQASTVVVQPGDSLWTIAVRALPGSDPRDVVGELKSINHLSTSELAVGQRLRLP